MWIQTPQKMSIEMIKMIIWIFIRIVSTLHRLTSGRKTSDSTRLSSILKHTSPEIVTFLNLDSLLLLAFHFTSNWNGGFLMFTHVKYHSTIRLFVYWREKISTNSTLDTWKSVKGWALPTMEQPSFDAEFTFPWLITAMNSWCNNIEQLGWIKIKHEI